MEYRVPEFILDIYACLYQEVDLDLHVMMSVMICDVESIQIYLSTKLRTIGLHVSQEMDTVIVILRISA